MGIGGTMKRKRVTTCFPVTNTEPGWYVVLESDRKSDAYSEGPWKKRSQAEYFAWSEVGCRHWIVYVSKERGGI